MADTFNTKGLSPIYGGEWITNGGSQQDGYWKQGEQVGWGKEKGNNEIINYDMDGKVIYEGSKGDWGQFLKGAALIVGGGLALAAAGVGVTAAATGAGAGAAAPSFMLDAAGYGETFLPGAATLGETAGAAAATDAATTGLYTGAQDLAAGAQTAANTGIDFASAGDSAVSVGTGGGGPGLINTPQEAFRLGELTDAATGTGSAAGGALDSTTGGIWNTVKNATSAISNWAKENPLWTNMLGGAANWVMNQNKLDNNLDVVKAQGQNQIDLEKLKEENRLAKQKAYSESVGSLRSPGLINARPLKRLDGSLVYGTNGLINQPVRG